MARAPQTQLPKAPEGMRALTSSEMAMFRHQYEAYEAWEEAVDLARRLYGAHVHSIRVEFDSEWPCAITARNKDGNKLLYDPQASFWQDREDDDDTPPPYEQVQGKVQEREALAWEIDRKERMNQMIMRNTERGNALLKPFFEGETNECPHIEFINDMEAPPTDCPLYDEHTPEEVWHEEADNFLSADEVLSFMLNNRDECYNAFTVDQPPALFFPKIYVPLTLQKES